MTPARSAPQLSLLRRGDVLDACERALDRTTTHD